MDVLVIAFLVSQLVTHSSLFFNTHSFMAVYMDLQAGNMYVKKQGFWCTKFVHKITKLKSISLSHTISSEKTNRRSLYLFDTNLLDKQKLGSTGNYYVVLYMKTTAMKKVNGKW